MEIDSLLSSQRWKILEIISKKPSSPIEIASQTMTSVAYISQQLKLLEAARLIKKERTGLVEKGKPRNLYSIVEESLHIILLIRGKSEKKSLKIDNHQKIILKIWLMPNESLRYIVEKIFWKIEDEINDVEGIFLDFSKAKNILEIVSESKKIRQKTDSISKMFYEMIEIRCIDRKQFSQYNDLMQYAIYDPHFLMNEKEKMKGGMK